MQFNVRMTSTEHGRDNADITASVELHLPLVSTGAVDTSGYQFPWIEQLVEWFHERTEGEHRLEFDDSESTPLSADIENPAEWEEVYELWDVTDVDAAVELAREAAHLPWVPDGGYITVREGPQADLGSGRRVEIDD